MLDRRDQRARHRFAWGGGGRQRPPFSTSLVQTLAGIQLVFFCRCAPQLVERPSLSQGFVRYLLMVLTTPLAPRFHRRKRRKGRYTLQASRNAPNCSRRDTNHGH